MDDDADVLDWGNDDEDQLLSTGPYIAHNTGQGMVGDGEESEDAISLDGYDDESQDYSGAARSRGDMNDDSAAAQSLATPKSSSVVSPRPRSSRSARRESSNGLNSFTAADTRSSPKLSERPQSRSQLPLPLTHALPPKPAVAPSVHMHTSIHSGIAATAMRVSDSQSGPQDRGETPLPLDWEIRHPRNDSRKVYYYNVRTQQSTWERPEGRASSVDVDPPASRSQAEPARERERERYHRTNENQGSSYRAGRNDGGSDVDMDSQVDPNKQNNLSYNDRHYRPGGNEEPTASIRISRADRHARSASPPRKESSSRSPPRRGRKSRRGDFTMLVDPLTAPPSPPRRRGRDDTEKEPEVSRQRSKHSNQVEDIPAEDIPARGRTRAGIHTQRSSSPQLRPLPSAAPAPSRRSRTKSPPPPSRELGHNKSLQEPDYASKLAAAIQKLPRPPADSVLPSDRHASRKENDRHSRFSERRSEMSSITSQVSSTNTWPPPPSLADDDPFLPDDLRESVRDRHPAEISQQRERGREHSPDPHYSIDRREDQSTAKGPISVSLPLKPMASSGRRSPSPRQSPQSRSRAPLPPQTMEFSRARPKDSNLRRSGRARSLSPPLYPRRETNAKEKDPPPHSEDRYSAGPLPPTGPRHQHPLHSYPSASNDTQIDYPSGSRSHRDRSPEYSRTSGRSQRPAYSPSEYPPDSDSEHQHSTTPVAPISASAIGDMDGDLPPRGPRAHRIQPRHHQQSYPPSLTEKFDTRGSEPFGFERKEDHRGTKKSVPPQHDWENSAPPFREKVFPYGWANATTPFRDSIAQTPVNSWATANPFRSSSPPPDPPRQDGPRHAIRESSQHQQRRPDGNSFHSHSGPPPPAPVPSQSGNMRRNGDGNMRADFEGHRGRGRPPYQMTRDSGWPSPVQPMPKLSSINAIPIIKKRDFAREDPMSFQFSARASEGIDKSRHGRDQHDEPLPQSTRTRSPPRSSSYKEELPILQRRLDTSTNTGFRSNQFRRDEYQDSKQDKSRYDDPPLERAHRAGHEGYPGHRENGDKRPVSSLGNASRDRDELALHLLPAPDRGSGREREPPPHREDYRHREEHHSSRYYDDSRSYPSPELRRAPLPRSGPSGQHDRHSDERVYASTPPTVTSPTVPSATLPPQSAGRSQSPVLPREVPLPRQDSSIQSWADPPTDSNYRPSWGSRETDASFSTQNTSKPPVRIRRPGGDRPSADSALPRPTTHPLPQRPDVSLPPPPNPERSSNPGPKYVSLLDRLSMGAPAEDTMDVREGHLRREEDYGPGDLHQYDRPGNANSLVDRLVPSKRDVEVAMLVDDDIAGGESGSGVGKRPKKARMSRRGSRRAPQNGERQGER